MRVVSRNPAPDNRSNSATSSSRANPAASAYATSCARWLVAATERSCAAASIAAVTSSSVAALMEGIGSGAVTAPFTAADDADCIIVIGARPAQNHPVAAT